MGQKKVRIAGLTRIADMPLNPVMAIKLSYHVDHLVLGFDAQGGYGRRNGTSYVDGMTWLDLFRRVHPFPPSCTVDMFEANTLAGYHHERKKKGVDYYFLQELLNRLDDIKPDIVLECEADAHFDYEGGFFDDLKAFIDSGADMLMMGTDTVTIDGRLVPNTPSAPHCRGYRWYPGIVYEGGCCKVRPKKEPDKRYLAKSKLKHYHLYTKQIEFERWKYYGKGQTERFFRRCDMQVPPDVQALF